MTKGPELSQNIDTFLSSKIRSVSVEAREIATELKALVQAISEVTNENFTTLVMSHEMPGATAERLQDLSTRVTQLKKSEAKKLQPLVDQAFELRKAVFDTHVAEARKHYAQVN